MWKNGRILSKKASRSAKKSNNLKEAGWTTIAGQFGPVRIEDVKKSKKSKNGKMKEKKQPKPFIKQ